MEQVRRMVAAVVVRESDPARPPFRRLAGATLASVLVAALAVAAVLTYRLVSPDTGDGWRDGDAVIVERESGARYVYRDGRLHPVPNFASAVLIAGTTRTVLVPRRSMDGVPRGIRLGIPDAPDSLPAALVGPPWTVCGSALFAGSDVPGSPVGEEGLLVRHPGGTAYLVWHGRRHPVREPAVVLPALGWGSAVVAPVPPAVLDALPAGAELARVPLPGRGQRSERVSGARVGDVFVVANQGGGRQYAVALRDGLAGVTQVQADLIAGDPATAGPVRPLTQGQFALLPKVADLVPVGELAPPVVTPVLGRVGRGVCAVVRSSAEPVEVRSDADGADRAVVPPGRGAIVEAGGTVYLVTDLGRRYPVTGPDVLATLGFAGVRPVALPAGVVTLLPAGGVLDPSAAGLPTIG